MMPTGISLYNATLRHQLFLERVKGFYFREFNTVLRNLEAELKAAVREAGVANVGDLTRTQFRALQVDVNRRQIRVWDAWRESFSNRAKQLAGVDMGLAARILEATAVPNRLGVTPTAADFLARGASLETLWASIQNSVIGANGQTLVEMLSSFTDSNIVKISSEVGKAYANNISAKQLVENITGGEAANAGTFKVIRSQSRAVIATGFQHVSSETHEALQKKNYSTYRWISVLDDKTTEICRHRNGKIFEYGKGPLPPAHYHCRSRIVPAISGSTPQEDINDQDEYLARLLTDAVLGKVDNRIGNFSEAVDLAHARPMTISQFGQTGPTITKPI